MGIQLDQATMPNLSDVDGDGYVDLFGSVRTLETPCIIAIHQLQEFPVFC